MKGVIKVLRGTRGRTTALNFSLCLRVFTRTADTGAADAPVLPHFLQVDNWCGTEPLSHFLSPSIPQALMNTSPGSRWRTIGGTCGLQSFGRKTSTAGFSAPPRGKTPAASAQVGQSRHHRGSGLALLHDWIIHIFNKPT